MSFRRVWGEPLLPKVPGQVYHTRSCIHGLVVVCVQVEHGVDFGTSGHFGAHEGREGPVSLPHPCPSVISVRNRAWPAHWGQGREAKLLGQPGRGRLELAKEGLLLEPMPTGLARGGVAWGQTR